MQIDAKQKKVLMAGGAGVVVVAALIARSRGGAGNASDPTASTVADSAMLPSTFADNGAGFGDLSSAIANGLGNVATSNDALAGAVNAGNQTVSDAVSAGVATGIADGLAAYDAAHAPADQEPPGRAPAGRPSKPKPKAKAHPKPRPKAKAKHPKPKPKPRPKPAAKHKPKPHVSARRVGRGRHGRGASRL